MANDTIFQPRYTNSWGLAIGINAYTHAPPLGHACHDAEAVGDWLSDSLGAKDERCQLLLDGAATRAAIMSAFLRFTKPDIQPDDRVVVFFAGHGYTQKAYRGDVGYLVPADGDSSDLASLIRWDELTRNSDLIQAKHVLFVMDACYGGLALTRSVAPGSLRFLKDMLQRLARQVITAGKANETVADANGPRPGHSLFTGYFLDAVEGAAAGTDGAITANGVMSFVYDRVSKDPYSRQSPHFGFLDGDGDFVLTMPRELESVQDDKIETDILIDSMLPSVSAESGDDRIAHSETVKNYLSEPRYRIRLDDFLNEDLRAFIRSTRVLSAATEGVIPATISERLRQYERSSERLSTAMLLTARWGGNDFRATLTRLAGRLVETAESQDGSQSPAVLRWYPAEYTMYASGIAALVGEDYGVLHDVFTAKTAPRVQGEPSRPLLVAVIDGMQDAARIELFKRLPGHENQYTPRSEYLFKALQPLIEDALYVGRAYEDLFDRYEIFAALTYADLTQAARRRVWGPAGRFAWKLARQVGQDPFTSLVAEAKLSGSQWPPLKSGFFQGSLERFEMLATEYAALVGKFGWW